MEIYEQIYIQKLETSTVKDRYLLIYNGLYYEASAPVVELLLCLQEEKNMDEAITSYIKKKFPYFSNGLQLFYLFLHTHGKQKNVRSHTLMVNKSGGKTTFIISCTHLCPHALTKSHNLLIIKPLHTVRAC